MTSVLSRCKQYFGRLCPHFNVIRSMAEWWQTRDALFLLWVDITALLRAKINMNLVLNVERRCIYRVSIIVYWYYIFGLTVTADMFCAFLNYHNVAIVLIILYCIYYISSEVVKCIRWPCRKHDNLKGGGGADTELEDEGEERDGDRICMARQHLWQNVVSLMQ